ncbi:MAG: hypothetical protein EA353_03165 [Puniceicoccaceae bacterium]|nr:MAG: hypothetical protein EA353_03165 [Puniceicoccaceae bacterium]
MIMETYISTVLINKLFKKLSSINQKRESELDEISKEFTDAKALAKYYVEPNCQHHNPADSSNDMVASDIRMPIYKFINEFFSHESPVIDGRNHLFVLADAGMGKTSLLVILKLLDLTSFFPKSTKCILLKLGDDSISKIRAIKNPRNTILLLDALDEDSNGVNNIAPRISDLISQSETFKKVIISCRTQYLPEGSYSPFDHLGQLVIKGYTCKTMFLSLFDDSQVEEYLKKRFPRSPIKREKGLRIIKKMDSLRFRPLLLSYVEDFFELDEDNLSEYRIYEELILAWLRREERKVRKNLGLDISYEDILTICLKLAETLQRTLETSLIPEDLERLVGEDEKFKILTHLDVGGRSLLNKNSDGAYRFSHYSIQEFLIAYAVVTNRIDADELIRATSKILEFIKPFRWKQIQVSKLDFDQSDIIEIIADEVNFDEGSFEKSNILNSVFSKSNFLNSRLTNAKITKSEFNDFKFDGSNMKNFKVTQSIFKNCSFNNSKCQNAEFSECTFIGCSFHESDFSKSTLSSCELLACNFGTAILDYSDLSDSDFIDCEFTATSTNFIKVTRALFKGLSKDTLNSETSDFKLADFED